MKKARCLKSLKKKEGGLSFLILCYSKWRNYIISILCATVFFIFLFSCRRYSVSTTNEIDSIAISETDDISLIDFNSLFSLSHIITLETNENSLIKDLTKIGLYKEYIYILDKDQKKIFVFDNKGHFIREYFHFGQSKGEYISIDDFEIKDENLFIYDGLKGYIYIYDLISDIFIRKIEVLKGSGIKIWDNNRFAINSGFGSANPKENKQNFSYTFYDSERPVLFDIPYNENLMGYSQRFDYGANYFYCYQDTTFALFLLNDTIYYLNDNGSLSPYLHLDFGVDRPSVKDSRETVNTYFKEKSPSSIFSFYKFYNQILFSYFFDHKRKYIIMDLSSNNKVLFNGILRDKENKLPLRITPYSQFNYNLEAENQLLSIIWPFEFKKSKENEHLFKEEINKEGNPYLIYYNYLRKAK